MLQYKYPRYDASSRASTLTDDNSPSPAAMVRHTFSAALFAALVTLAFSSTVSEKAVPASTELADTTLTLSTASRSARSDFVQNLCNEAYYRFGGGKHNVMVIHPAHSYSLSGLKHKFKRTHKGRFLNTGFLVYVFKSGWILNKGDGGFENWCFRGKFKRSGFQGKFVRFSSF